MGTASAALQANVTAATVRTWARRGVVAAEKVGRLWAIDTESLARRIAIAAMRTRKAAAVTEPVEVHIDTETSIRAHQETSPAYGTTSWFAYEYINGWKVSAPAEGDTADQAIEAMRQSITTRRQESAALDALEESGVYADLAGTRAPGMLRTLDSLTVKPRHASSHECHFCGLDDRSCDCR